MSSSDDEAGDGAAIAPPRAKTMSRWKPEEDVMLSQLVNVQLRNMATEDQTINWTKISASMASRTSKQCRERYVNHIKPDINRDPFNADEDMVMVEHHMALGTAWSALVRVLQGRSENMIKNRWNTLLRCKDLEYRARTSPLAAYVQQLKAGVPSSSALQVAKDILATEPPKPVAASLAAAAAAAAAAADPRRRSGGAVGPSSQHGSEGLGFDVIAGSLFHTVKSNTPPRQPMGGSMANAQMHDHSSSPMSVAGDSAGRVHGTSVPLWQDAVGMHGGAMHAVDRMLQEVAAAASSLHGDMAPHAPAAAAPGYGDFMDGLDAGLHAMGSHSMQHAGHCMGGMQGDSMHAAMHVQHDQSRQLYMQMFHNHQQQQQHAHDQQQQRVPSNASSGSSADTGLLDSGSMHRMSAGMHAPHGNTHSMEQLTHRSALPSAFMSAAWHTPGGSPGDGHARHPTHGSPNMGAGGMLGVGHESTMHGSGHASTTEEWMLIQRMRLHGYASQGGRQIPRIDHAESAPSPATNAWGMERAMERATIHGSDAGGRMLANAYSMPGSMPHGAEPMGAHQVSASRACRMSAPGHMLGNSDSWGGPGSCHDAGIGMDYPGMLRDMGRNPGLRSISELCVLEHLEPRATNYRFHNQLGTLHHISEGTDMHSNTARVGAAAYPQRLPSPPPLQTRSFRGASLDAYLQAASPRALMGVHDVGPGLFAPAGRLTPDTAIRLHEDRSMMMNGCGTNNADDADVDELLIPSSSTGQGLSIGASELELDPRVNSTLLNSMGSNASWDFLAGLTSGSFTRGASMLQQQTRGLGMSRASAPGQLQQPAPDTQQARHSPGQAHIGSMGNMMARPGSVAGAGEGATAALGAAAQLAVSSCLPTPFNTASGAAADAFAAGSMDNMPDLAKEFMNAKWALDGLMQEPAATGGINGAPDGAPPPAAANPASSSPNAGGSLPAMHAHGMPLVDCDGRGSATAEGTMGLTRKRVSLHTADEWASDNAQLHVRRARSSLPGQDYFYGDPCLDRTMGLSTVSEGQLPKLEAGAESAMLASQPPACKRASSDGILVHAWPAHVGSSTGGQAGLLSSHCTAEAASGAHSTSAFAGMFADEGDDTIPLGIMQAGGEDHSANRPCFTTGKVGASEPHVGSWTGPEAMGRSRAVTAIGAGESVMHVKI